MKKILSCLLPLITILSLCVPAFARNADEGLPGYFLDLGLGSRALGMGRSFAAVSDDASAVYYNPAGMSLLTRRVLSFTHVSLFEGARYNSIAFASPSQSRWSCGLGLMQLSADGIIKRDASNVAGDELKDASTALFIAGSYVFDRELSFGLGTKVVNKQFDDINKTWAAADLSALYLATSRITFGLNMQNIFSLGTEWTAGRTYDVPLNTKFGVSYKMLQDKLLLALDLNSISYQPAKIQSGIEYLAYKNVALRCGYDRGDLTMGFGAFIKEYRLDYALLNHVLGPSHRVTVGCTFGAEHEKRLTRRARAAASYQVKTDVMKEIPAAIYHILKDKGITVLNVEITNRSEQEARFRVAYRASQKNPIETKEVSVPGKTSKTLQLMPALTREDIMQIAAVPTPGHVYVEVDALDPIGTWASIYKETLATSFLPYDQFSPQAIDAGNNRFDLLDTLVNWVTYNDRKLAEVINKASEKGAQRQPPVKIVGFQSPSAFTQKPRDNRSLAERIEDCQHQVELVYNTLKDDYKVLYVNQPVAYKNSQRIKMPAQTLQNKGNCVELAVLFASVLESIEIDPILVIFPEDRHAAVAWRAFGDGREEYILLETNVFGESFNTVLSKGRKLAQENGLAEAFAQGIVFDENGMYKKGNTVVLFDVRKMRAQLPPSPYVPD